MKALLLVVCMFVFISTAYSQTFAPQTPVLICSKGGVELTIGICGIRGCDAVVRQSTAVHTYNVKRIRYHSGALDYVPGPRSTTRCTFKISALHNGGRIVTNTPACAPSLKSAVCHWVYP